MTFHATRYHRMLPCVECGTMTRAESPRCPACRRLHLMSYTPKPIYPGQLERIRHIVSMQVRQFNKNCSPNVPEWYETKRKTTHIIFWDFQPAKGKAPC